MSSVLNQAAASSSAEASPPAPAPAPAPASASDSDDEDGKPSASSSSGDSQVEAAIEQLLQEEFGMSKFGRVMAMQFLRKQGGPGDASGDMSRVYGWILDKLNKRLPRGPSPWQKGCPEIVPKLEARPLWDTKDEVRFPWIKALEEAFPVIREELLSLRGRGGFQPYRAPSSGGGAGAAAGAKAKAKGGGKDGVAAPGPPAAPAAVAGPRGKASHDAGDWNVFYIHLHNVDCAENRLLCPKTTEIVDAIPRRYDHVFFSAMAPSTHITAHHGPTNKKLRCHLPLVVPGGKGEPGKEGPCRLRVGDTVHTVREGECFIFDDSLEHEAWNDEGEKTRIVLIVDIWHPDLSDREVKFLDFVLKSQMRMQKKMCERHEAAMQQQQQQQQQQGKEKEQEHEDGGGAHGDAHADSGGADGDAEAKDEINFESFYSIIEEAKQFAPDDELVFGDHQ